MTTEKICDYMTAHPFTVNAGEDMRRAYSLMRSKGIRHLPVEKDGELVGLVSLGDLDLVQSYADIDRRLLTVAEAMTPDPYCVQETAALDAVADAMAERRLGSAIVVDAQRNVVGIFTAVDALRVLARRLRQG